MGHYRPCHMGGHRPCPKDLTGGLAESGTHRPMRLNLGLPNPSLRLANTPLRGFAFDHEDPEERRHCGPRALLLFHDAAVPRAGIVFRH